ncbi:hypothetical protein [Micromonospora coxensis]|uniref:hypothetical protein n=1 Tax=Micromonospora coxensis TaxID=356852 RepID=UPI0012FE5152|nr:hypothetical protein [Micromonospora coxensis]
MDALATQRATQIRHQRTPTTPVVSHVEQVRRYGDSILAAIDDDMRAGFLPAGIGSFVDLHR